MSDRKYGRAWKRIRDKYIADHPFCEMCLAKSLYIPYHVVQPSLEVHHIVPLCEGGTHKKSNLMALCHKCHAEIHMKEEEKI